MTTNQLDKVGADLSDLHEKVDRLGVETRIAMARYSAIEAALAAHIAGRPASDRRALAWAGIFGIAMVVGAMVIAMVG